MTRAHRFALNASTRVLLARSEGRRDLRKGTKFSDIQRDLSPSASRLFLRCLTRNLHRRRLGGKRLPAKRASDASKSDPPVQAVSVKDMITLELSDLVALLYIAEADNAPRGLAAPVPSRAALHPEQPIDTLCRHRIYPYVELLHAPARQGRARGQRQLVLVLIP